MEKFTVSKELKNAWIKNPPCKLKTGAYCHKECPYNDKWINCGEREQQWY